MSPHVHWYREVRVMRLHDQTWRKTRCRCGRVRVTKLHLDALPPPPRCAARYDGGGYERDGCCILSAGHEGDHQWPIDPFR